MMNVSGVITFSGSGWLLPSSVFLVVVGAILVWSYRAAQRGPVRWVCLLLKALALIALALCLLEPLWFGERPRPGANLFAVVADNSQGMQIKDRGEAKSRGELLRDLVDLQRTTWQSKLGETFEVRRYLFDGRLQTTADFHDLVFDGNASGIATALRTLAERFKGRPLAGVLLFTDGNATDIRGAMPEIAGLPPIYPVVMGQREAVQDVALQQVNVSQSAFEDAPVAIQADVTSAGFKGQPIVAQLVDRSGHVVQEHTLEGRKDDETMAFRFQLKPEQKGLSFYQVRVAPRSGSLAANAPTTEATLLNNQRTLVVDRGQGPYRILYVSGRPNWEFKFLNRAVQEDKEVELVGLIRVAKREPKFSFRGRAGETSNPLYRGFGEQSAEELQQYDQPVLVRLNTRDELELRSGFPRTPEDLYSYNAVILDDLEAEFFSADQSALLQKFVAERGGGFLMLGGMESFREGKYQRTPIGDMLPVYLDRGEPVPTAPGPVKLQLAREGWLQPWARLRDNESDERTRQDSMPPFLVMNRVQGIKPGASVIATARDEAGEDLPAMVVQRFGRGRSAALMLGDVWKWGMHDAEAHTDMDKAWRQWMRWLVADVPNRVELTVEPSPTLANGSMLLQVRARDAKFQPLDDATVAIDVEPVTFDAASAQPPAIRLQAEPSLAEPGLYTAVYVPRLTGGYKATATVTNNAGAESGRADAGWTTDLAAEEFKSLTPNVALLEGIARKTGGQVIAARDLDSFVSGLSGRAAPVMETWSYPLWHTPVTFLFALLCLVAEWGLRRAKGLA